MSSYGVERHVLGLSGGRDSAALAVYMREDHPDLDIEYFFTDTGKELPEVYEFLVKLEGFLGKPIRRLNPDRDFDFWLKQYGNFLPSAQTRWCTRQLKLAALSSSGYGPCWIGATLCIATWRFAPTRNIGRDTHPSTRT